MIDPHIGHGLTDAIIATRRARGGRARRIRTTGQAASLRAGILTARHHLDVEADRSVTFHVDASALDRHSRLFARAYIRTKVRHGARRNPPLGYAHLGYAHLAHATLNPAGLGSITPTPDDPIDVDALRYTALADFIDDTLRRELVPEHRYVDRNTIRLIHRYASTSLEYYDRTGARRVLFYVTTPDLERVDALLPRGPLGEWPPDGWSPAVPPASAGYLCDEPDNGCRFTREHSHGHLCDPSCRCRRLQAARA